MTNDDYTGSRKSTMKMGEIYFWTATINNWQHLLKEDQFKDIIIQSLDNLSERRLIDVFAFTIMPNHIHLIWRINALNGKETAQGSFLKFTAHEFKKLLKAHPETLEKFVVTAPNKKYEFWQRDSLAIHLYSRKVMLQKLNYIHLNPLSGRWHLVSDPSDYYYSSARYYEINENAFAFLKDVRMEF
jgi:putative transposase